MAATSSSSSEEQSGISIKFNRWTRSETKLLIMEWSEPHIQAGLRDMKRNISIFKDLQARLQEQGYIRSVEQIKLKLKNLKKEYLKVKNHNPKSRQNPIECEFFEDLDAIMGTKDIVIVNAVTCDNFDENDSTESPQTCQEIPDETSLTIPPEIEIEDTEIVQEIEEFTSRKKRKCKDWIDKFIEYDRTAKKLAREARCRLELQLAEKQEKAMREENEKNRILLEKLNQREIEHEASMMKMFTNAIVLMSQALKK
ncbi:hypothetical protein CHUAL_011606 [Chamberlinius hualienensis]